jgi:small subunit ribosomal protein S17
MATKKEAAPKAAKPAAAKPAAQASASAADHDADRKDRRTLVGEVTSDKMHKTVVVRVTHRVRSMQYQKYMTKRVKYKAHDEKNEFKIGDRVEIAESRPMSKDKRWRVTRLVERAKEAVQANA